MDVSLFDYRLPQNLIAQRPIEPRDAARLMVLRREDSSITHDAFHDLPLYLRAGDCLVVNETRVMPARLLGRKEPTGGAVEVLLLRPRTETTWEALVKPGRRLAPGTSIVFGDGAFRARVIERLDNGGRLIGFEGPGGEVERALASFGRVPLPPYIHEPLQDSERYQTVYASHETSVAAPTAGLHFTPLLLERIRDAGVRVVSVRLSVGIDTFRPVSVRRVEDHQIHREDYEIDADAARQINETKSRGGRVFAIGTTSTRVLETAADQDGTVHARSGQTGLFIRPGYRFKVVDALVTNFHLPRSSLLMLVGAFTGLEPMMEAYETAIEERYRFFSFGDAMLIV